MKIFSVLVFASAVSAQLDFDSLGLKKPNKGNSAPVDKVSRELVFSSQLFRNKKWDSGNHLNMIWLDGNDFDKRNSDFFEIRSSKKRYVTSVCRLNIYGLIRFMDFTRLAFTDHNQSLSLKAFKLKLST